MPLCQPLFWHKAILWWLMSRKVTQNFCTYFLCSIFIVWLLRPKELIHVACSYKTDNDTSETSWWHIVTLVHACSQWLCNLVMKADFCSWDSCLFRTASRFIMKAVLPKFEHYIRVAQCSHNHRPRHLLFTGLWTLNTFLSFIVLLYKGWFCPECND